jgi:hypothetical protein
MLQWTQRLRAWLFGRESISCRDSRGSYRQGPWRFLRGISTILEWWELEHFLWLLRQRPLTERAASLPSKRLATSLLGPTGSVLLLSANCSECHPGRDFAHRPCDISTHLHEAYRRCPSSGSFCCYGLYDNRNGVHRYDMHCIGHVALLATFVGSLRQI